ncbi:putative protein kinase [Planoprotostelium fungivorum]|uniref:non-specific serine/threonine protein kinase n=1 Tax=Planoprotostelium fungivorum TaxID=1890364 RepID=A0A2P6NSH1_9EUKA|nr:putative protein kinase [Planoprotostelium fungivorum]
MRIPRQDDNGHLRMRRFSLLTDVKHFAGWSKCVVGGELMDVAEDCTNSNKQYNGASKSSFAQRMAASYLRKIRHIFPKKKRLEDHYQIKEKLGVGFSSTVFKGIQKSTGEEVALKIFHKANLTPQTQEDLNAERDILCRYGGHKGVITLKDVFEDSKRVILVMKGGSLFDIVQKKRRLCEKSACHVIREMLETLAFLHSKGIVHRDIKLENILCHSEGEEGRIKICDFAFARQIYGGTLNVLCGSPAYVAPEVLRGEGYGRGVDVWSLGVVLYILLSGSPPFHGDGVEVMMARIAEGVVVYPSCWSSVSNLARDLVSHMLQSDPLQRITPQEALHHPWFLVHSEVYNPSSVEYPIRKNLLYSSQKGNNH